MKFYNRKEELEILHEIQQQFFNDHSRFTVVTGATTDKALFQARIEMKCFTLEDM